MSSALAGRGLAAAIVDLDGTLVDTVGDFEVALAAALGDLGLPPVDRRFIAETIGKGSEHLTFDHRVTDGAPAARFAELWPLYVNHYLAVNGRHSARYPGVLEGLEGLARRGWPLACVTNKPTAFVGPLLDAMQLARFFAVVFGGDAFARRKPDPYPLEEACRRLGVAPARTLVIGDSSNDAEAARAAGCPVVLVSYGYNHGEPAEAAAPDAVIGRLDALESLLGFG
jgi:phosphoglycolate phosphatase